MDDKPDIPPADPSAAYMLPGREVLRPEVHADGFDATRDGLQLSADVVIVGAGPGGGALARILSEGGLSVIVLEEGPAQSNFRPNYAHTARYHMQESGAMLARGTAMMPIAAAVAYPLLKLACVAPGLSQIV